MGGGRLCKRALFFAVHDFMIFVEFHVLMVSCFVKRQIVNMFFVLSICVLGMLLGSFEKLVVCCVNVNCFLVFIVL